MAHRWWRRWSSKRVHREAYGESAPLFRSHQVPWFLRRRIVSSRARGTQGSTGTINLGSASFVRRRHTGLRSRQVMVVELANATPSEGTQAIEDVHVLTSGGTAREISVALPRRLRAVEQGAIGGDSSRLVKVFAQVALGFRKHARGAPLHVDRGLSVGARPGRGLLGSDARGQEKEGHEDVADHQTHSISGGLPGRERRFTGPR